MSIELPEAQILSNQMNRELRGKRIGSYRVKDYQKLQKIGFINKEISAFDRIVDGTIESVTSRGNVIRVKLDNGMNLILAPEYGGRVLYHTDKKSVPEKFHLRLDFTDGTVLTVALTGMGIIQTLKDNELEQSYVYRRDFSQTASPADEKTFSAGWFAKQLADRNVSVKTVLVGRDAVVVGLSNSAFQDILYRAGIYPKRKASSLSESERCALHAAIKTVIRDRIRLGGKDQFMDLYGKHGQYAPAMGPDMKEKTCPTCKTRIEKLSLGGGQIYFCPGCQK